MGIDETDLVDAICACCGWIEMRVDWGLTGEKRVERNRRQSEWERGEGAYLRARAWSQLPQITRVALSCVGTGNGT